VNISPKQFRHQDVAEVISETLKITKLEPKYLEIEITETAVMDDVENTIGKLNNIRKMGIPISIDDFGTGYTSISYLKQFPINTLKIDQHFIRGINNNKDDMAIISAVIALGHNLGLEIVAEGVETQDQMEYLIEHHCDILQGYYLSRPLPENKITLQFSKNGKTQDEIIQPI
jgi:EAL domain-containing protein (putative c-di-GMP-specific phosphodiesterase class I)